MPPQLTAGHVAGQPDRNATIIGVPGFSTPLFQPLPDGPITVPAHSANVPVTSTAGFTIGQKIALGYGRTFETATVTAVGTPGSQSYLAAAAAAGATTLKVTSTTSITAGDKIRLDIGSRTEDVTVASVGTPGASGTGLTLNAPLKFRNVWIACVSGAASCLTSSSNG